MTMQNTRRKAGILGGLAAVMLGVASSSRGEDPFAFYMTHVARVRPEARGIVAWAANEINNTARQDELRRILGEEYGQKMDALLKEYAAVVSENQRLREELQSRSQQQNNQGENSRYFNCSYWKDLDRDGIVGREEFIGIRKSGAVIKDSERIEFVAAFDAGEKIAGKVLKQIVYGPKGQVLAKHSREDKLPYDSCTIRSFEDVMPWLLKEGGYGNYLVCYYLDGQFDGSFNFKLEK